MKEVTGLLLQEENIQLRKGLSEDKEEIFLSQSREKNIMQITQMDFAILEQEPFHLNSYNVLVKVSLFSQSVLPFRHVGLLESVFKGSTDEFRNPKHQFSLHSHA